VRIVGALALTLALTGCGSAGTPTPQLNQPPPAQTTQAAAQIGALRIPAIGVDTQLVRLGLTDTGAHEVPPLQRSEVAGWYSLGVAPGDVGPAIILGHINGGGKPGVFAGLPRLEAGNQIVVERDGRPITFVVYDMVKVDKDAFPTDRVYADTPGPELRLITCGGVLDRSVGHYEDNIIVFARQV
jgi:sortase (surface protein transpeptidase)